MITTEPTRSMATLLAHRFAWVPPGHGHPYRSSAGEVSRHVKDAFSRWPKAAGVCPADQVGDRFAAPHQSIRVASKIHQGSHQSGRRRRQAGWCLIAHRHCSDIQLPSNLRVGRDWRPRRAAPSPPVRCGAPLQFPAAGPAAPGVESSAGRLSTSRRDSDRGHRCPRRRASSRRSPCCRRRLYACPP